MRGRRLLLLLVVLLALPTLLPTVLPAQEEGDAPRVVIRTSLGEIVVELRPVQAPNTTRNFLHYVDGGFYVGGSFHRTVTAENQPNDSIRIAVIQGDIDRSRRDETLDPILLERTSVTGLLHKEGTISMARFGPDSAVASFFICVGDQPELNFGGRRNSDGQGFAAFGQVVEGMDVVLRINRAPADGQSLSPPIEILSIERIDQ